MVKKLSDDAQLHAPELLKEEVCDKNQREKRVKINQEPRDEMKRFKKSKFEPKNWRAMYSSIRLQRLETMAAVDTMGCEAWFRRDPHLPEKERRFRCLIALMLSSQTKDEITHAAMRRLTNTDNGKEAPEHRFHFGTEQ